MQDENRKKGVSSLIFKKPVTFLQSQRQASARQAAGVFSLLMLALFALCVFEYKSTSIAVTHQTTPRHSVSGIADV
jgi:hypothetical protein